MNTGFVICSRLESSRVPNKAFIRYNGKPHIEHLIERLLRTDIRVYVAVPEQDAAHYGYLLDKYPKRVFLSVGHGNDPLRRMYGVAKQHGLDSVIRVTHDKIFVNTDVIFGSLDMFNSSALDYLYSSKFVPGTGFEIISTKALAKAAEAYKRVEHISYAIKAVTDNKMDFVDEPMTLDNCDQRLLIDHPEDVELMHVLLSAVPSTASLHEVTKFLNANPWVKNINRLPLVTVYTCAYNAEKWIEQAMGSVAAQTGFGDFEYVLIDDNSSDRTPYLMAKFCQLYKNARWVRNQSNIGLASSSNVALKRAKGKFIIRLDADDYFTANDAIQEMIDEMADRGLDAVYPNNWEGCARKAVQKGSEHHHVGGTLFRTSAINHVKFTEGLRNYEGLDLFTRAQAQVKVGYLNKPVFVYRQHGESMSKTNHEERELTKKIILGMEDSEPGEKKISSD